MSKKIYLALTIEENGKFYSYVLETKSNRNLVSVFAGIRGLVSANVCDTLRKANEIVRAWCDAYKANGTYLFD